MRTMQFRSGVRSLGMLAVLGVPVLIACSADPPCRGPSGLCVELPTAAQGASAGTTPAPSPGGTNAGADAGKPEAGRMGVGGTGQSLDEGKGLDGFGGEVSGGSTGCAGTMPPDFSITPSHTAWLEPTGPLGSSGKELLQLASCEVLERLSNDYNGGWIDDCYAFEWTPRDLSRVSFAWQPNGYLLTERAGACVGEGADSLTFTVGGHPVGETVTFGIAGVPLTTVVIRDSAQVVSIPLGILEDLAPLAPGVSPGFYFEWEPGPEPATKRLLVMGDLYFRTGVTPEACVRPADLAVDCNAPVGSGPFTNPTGDTPGVCDEVAPPPDDGSTNVPVLLLDDFEDGDDWAQLLPNGQALWTTINNSFPDPSLTGYQYPEPCVRPTHLDLIDGSSAPANTRALLTYGCGMGWENESGLRLIMRSGDLDCQRPFDASSYDGVQFRARASLPMVLQVATSATTSQSEGGFCEDSGGPDVMDEPLEPPVGARTAYALWPDDGNNDPASAPQVECLAPFESQQLFTGDDWAVFRIPFASLRRGWGGAEIPFEELDPTTLTSLSWKIRFGGSSGNLGFTFAIDDVALYRE